MDLMENGSFQEYIKCFNYFGQKMKNVKDTAYAVRQNMKWKISDQILYEIVGKTFVLSLDAKGLVYLES